MAKAEDNVLSPDVRERCGRIGLLVMDVDGVLTDGSIVYADDGTELKTFHVRDGSGLKLWARSGKKAAVLTGRMSPVVERRAGELDLVQVVQGARDKGASLRQILEENKQVAAETCFVGDDVPDLPALKQCGLAVAVADACPEVIAQAHYVTRAHGGRGAVRETIEMILRVQGIWDKIVDSYLK